MATHGAEALAVVVDAVQGRNIEVGARIESPRFASHLVAHFHAALSAGVFVEVDRSV